MKGHGLFYRCIRCNNLIPALEPYTYPVECGLDDGGCGRTTDPSDEWEWTVFEIIVCKRDDNTGRWSFYEYP